MKTLLCEETNDNHHQTENETLLDDNSDKGTSSFAVEDETSKASLSYYSNIDPLTQLSAEDDNSSSSNSSLETEKSDKQLNQENQSTTSSRSISENSTNDESNISYMSSNGLSNVANDPKKYIHYGQSMQPPESNETDF